MGVRVTAPGIVPHVFPLPDRPGSDRFTLKVGRPARLAGSVTNASGQPVANVPVEVWVENMVYQSRIRTGSEAERARPSLIHFDSGPIRTGADGSFLTPPQLMTGWSYKIIIRPEGDPLVSSDSLTAKTELTTVPPVRLPFNSAANWSGLVHDRRGQPVAGARVFLPSGEPTTTTDAQGRFLLEGILPGRTYFLVQAEGFRLQGWPVVPARAAPGADDHPRSDRANRPTARWHPCRPRSPWKSRAPWPAACSSRTCKPHWKRVTTMPGNGPQPLEPDRPRAGARFAREAPLSESLLRRRPPIGIATELLATDPVEAESIIAAIANPGIRVLGYVALAEALPAADRDRKRKLLEHATVQVHAPADAGRGTDPRDRLRQLARVAGGWLDLGEVEKARPLIREGWEIAARCQTSSVTSGLPGDGGWARDRSGLGPHPRHQHAPAPSGLLYGGRGIAGERPSGRSGTRLPAR